MYVDLIITFVLLLFVIIYSKRFQNYIFGIATIDILYRIINLIEKNVPIKVLNEYISKYLPSSLLSLVDKYINSSISIIFLWIYIVVMVIFLYYCIKIFIKRKKIV